MKIDNYSSKDIYMIMAKLVAQRSKTPIKAGAVIVSEDNRILSIGYNSFPGNNENGIESCLDNSIVHASLKALLDFSGSKLELKQSTIYTNIFPCKSCAQAIIHCGISYVFYESLLNDRADISETTKLFDTFQIGYYKHIANYNLLNEIISASNWQNDISYSGGVLKVKNQNGCSRPDTRYCSCCDASINIEHTCSKNINYCYKCGIKFKN